MAISIYKSITRDKILTNSVQHLVAFIENKDLDAAQSKVLVSHEGIQSTWSSNEDVRVSLLILQDLSILLNWGTSIEHCGLDIWHVLAEASILVLDLISQLTSVAHNQNGGLSCNRFDLLKCSENEDCGFSETRFGLAENVGTEDCLRNAYLLDCRVNRAEVRSKCLPQGLQT